jgi:hypothetical protein
VFLQVVGSIAAYAGVDVKDWEKAHMPDAVTVLQANHMDAISAAANAATEYVDVVVVDVAAIVSLRIRQTSWDLCHRAMIWKPRAYPMIEALCL